MIARTATMWSHLIHGVHNHHLRQQAMLLVLLLAVLMMPVSYRAGSDSAHPHTIFQGVIDAVRGEPHHHGEPVTTGGPSPFLPPAIPLSPTPATAPDLADVDIPLQLQMSAPLIADASLLTLGLLVAVLLAWTHRQAAWVAVAKSLQAVVLPLEPPPPRTPAA